MAGGGPLAYFLTWTTYRSWLHGDDRGSVDPWHHGFEAPVRQPDPHIYGRRRAALRDAPFIMDTGARVVVDQAIRRTCDARGWELVAVNVRSNHVHAVVAADNPPERVLATLKAWATRALRENGLVGCHRPLWTRHGSTRYLWRDRDVSMAADYVIDGQDWVKE